MLQASHREEQNLFRLIDPLRDGFQWLLRLNTPQTTVFQDRNSLIPSD